MIGALALLAQLAVVVHAPDSASACEAIEISVAVSSGARVPELIAPSLSPFDVLQFPSQPHGTFNSRQNTMLTEYRYVVATDHAGTFTIPPFEVRDGGDVVRSRAIQIAIHPRSGRGLPLVVARARVDTSLAITFRNVAAPETVYVGQQANYDVAVFLNDVVRERLRRNPTFFPPDMQSMLAYDLPSHGDTQHRQVGGGGALTSCFDALIYQRALFPLMAGRFSIPPAQLVYSLPLSASFFAREETHELATDSTVVIAVDPPPNGRPVDYQGAVGDLRVAARLDSTASRVGDPLVLTVRVSGTGNVKLFPRPAVGIPWATLVKGDERVNVDTTALRIAGTKEFDWVLTPRIAGELDVPPIHYPYFNPSSRRYEVASTSASHLRVGAGTLASGDTARTENLLALRTRDRGVPAAPLHEHPAFWMVLALVPLPAVSARARARRRSAAARSPNPAARLAVLTRDAVKARDACEVRRAYTNALADRLALNPETFTRAGSLARALRRRGVSTDVALDAEKFLRQLDEAAFSASGALPADAADKAVSVYKLVDAESLPRAQFAIPALCIAGLLAIGVATAHAYDQSLAQRSFDEGVAAYQHHDFRNAREAFIVSIDADPRSPDAWANLGTAAWAVADTAGSVAGWQHALRSEPLATDMRERAELVHALPWNSAGYVPPLPVAWLFDLAALAWIGVWGIAAYRAWRDRALALGVITTVSVAAALLTLGGFALADRVSGRHAGVLRKTLALNADPDLQSEHGATGIVGEVVRVAGRQGAWSRVVLDDGRDGWVQSEDVISLDARDVGQIVGE